MASQTCQASCRVCEVAAQYGLTRTETYVLCLTAKNGLSNRKISGVLGCLIGTVVNHNQNIHRKIGTGDRLEMALWAIAKGMVRV